MVSSGYGEEPRSRAAADSSVQARAALAASIPLREAELAKRQSQDVLTEVTERAQEMGVSASIEELTDLLGQRANLEIGLDKCQLGEGSARSCRAQEAALVQVEAIFLEKAGLSTREFRAGRRDLLDGGLREASANGAAAGFLGGLATKSGETCTCAFNVYSSDRWMNRWWGLECNGHASHGVCSNNVDSAHSPGSGAMTGDVDLFFGGYHANRDCPDDHYTCFRGPSYDHVGAWGNTCSCDTWHSQYSNPYISWYGGDLTDAQEVAQLYTQWYSVGGACNSASVTVAESIQEHDPICCDDSMGTLWATLPLTEGYGTVSGQTSAQNCNGGSQSGVYPYCGTFGATIRVGYSCSTYTPPVCDPQDEANCWDLGWIWSSSSCSCSPPADECQYSSLKMRPICPLD